jgi:ATP-dependent Clp protease adaptor protein ClpS
VKERTRHSESFELNEVADRIRERNLILHNDEVNTFDHVIDSLMDICEHDFVQAEQCTFIVHYKGKCDVKKGSYDLLKSMKEGLIEKGLTATID